MPVANVHRRITKTHDFILMGFTRNPLTVFLSLWWGVSIVSWGSNPLTLRRIQHCRWRNKLFNALFWFQLIWFAQQTTTISWPCDVLATTIQSSLACM